MYTVSHGKCPSSKARKAIVTWYKIISSSYILTNALLRWALQKLRSNPFIPGQPNVLS